MASSLQDEWSVNCEKQTSFPPILAGKAPGQRSHDGLGLEVFFSALVIFNKLKFACCCCLFVDGRYWSLCPFKAHCICICEYCTASHDIISHEEMRSQGENVGICSSEQKASSFISVGAH